MKHSTTETILDAIKDLHAQEQIVTRETLADLTGLKMTIVDDRVSYLVEDGRVLRVQRGVFVPAPEHKPARIITKTLLPGGTIKLEIGDDHIITLTPREGRMLGQMMLGAGLQFASIEAGHYAAQMASELCVEIRRVRQDVSALHSNVGGLPAA